MNFRTVPLLSLTSWETKTTDSSILKWLRKIEFNRLQRFFIFFNTPPGLEAADIEEIFVDQGTPRPKCVKMFPSKTERSSSGLIEFENLSEALESLLIANHVPVDNPTGKFPYIMKLCFSSSKAIPTIIH